MGDGRWEMGDGRWEMGDEEEVFTAKTPRWGDAVRGL